MEFDLEESVLTFPTQSPGTHVLSLQLTNYLLSQRRWGNFLLSSKQLFRAIALPHPCLHSTVYLNRSRASRIETNRRKRQTNSVSLDKWAPATTVMHSDTWRVTWGTQRNSGSCCAGWCDSPHLILCFQIPWKEKQKPKSITELRDVLHMNVRCTCLYSGWQIHMHGPSQWPNPDAENSNPDGLVDPMFPGCCEEVITFSRAAKGTQDHRRQDLLEVTLPVGSSSHT